MESPLKARNNMSMYGKNHYNIVISLKCLGIKPPYDPAITLLGICPEEVKTEKDISPKTYRWLTQA